MGGDSAKDQIRQLAEGVDVVCGTPGRLDDLISTGKLDREYFLILGQRSSCCAQCSHSRWGAFRFLDASCACKIIIGLET